MGLFGSSSIDRCDSRSASSNRQSMIRVITLL
jgi:hypothetical protein